MRSRRGIWVGTPREGPASQLSFQQRVVSLGVPLLWAWAQPFFRLSPQYLGVSLSSPRSPAFLVQRSLGLQTVISDCILAPQLEQPQLCCIPPPGSPGRGHPASGGASIPHAEAMSAILMEWLLSDESLPEYGTDVTSC